MKKIHRFYLVRFLLLTLFLSCFNLTKGQNPAYYKIDDEKGLPSNETYQILQDDFGYIWIGSDAGLYRYDVFNFKQYSNSKQNGRGISFLQIDSKQRVWLWAKCGENTQTKKP